jgi:hypothetical protein
MAISFTDIKVVLSKTPAFLRRTALRYCAGVVPVSCLKRCRKREPERFTRLANSATSHEREHWASILEMTTSILRSISDEDLDAKMHL